MGNSRPQIKKQPLRIFLGNFEDPVNEVLRDFVKNIVGNRYDVRFASKFRASDMFRLTQDREFDMFILTLNNIMLLSNDRGSEKHKEQMLKYVSLVREMYGKPVIVLFGWPDDPSWAEKAEKAGANFALRMPFKLSDFSVPFEKCLSEVPSHGGMISLLLPYYLDETFSEAFQDLGLRVLGGHSRETTKRVVMENEPDVAIEWQHGRNDFPIRDLLREYRRKTPVVLSLNWNGSLPDNFEELGYMGYVNVPFKTSELLRFFYRVLPDRKRSILAKMCELADIELDRSDRLLKDH